MNWRIQNRLCRTRLRSPKAVAFSSIYREKVTIDVLRRLTSLAISYRIFFCSKKVGINATVVKRSNHVGILKNNNNNNIRKQ